MLLLVLFTESLSAQNVGIGTTVPSYKLDIWSDTLNRALNVKFFPSTPTGNVYGIRTETVGNSSGASIGAEIVANSLGDGDSYGLQARAFMVGSGQSYGIRTLNQSTSGGHRYGLYSDVTGISNGAATSVYAKVSGVANISRPVTAVYGIVEEFTTTGNSFAIRGVNYNGGYSAWLQGKARIVSGEEADLTNDGFLQIDNSTAQNLVLDGDEIQARDDGSNSHLYINYHGGDVLLSPFLSTNGQVGVGYLSLGALSTDYKLGVSGRTLIRGGGDAGYSGNGFLQLGDSNESNTVFDNNEILARNNGLAAPLYLQHDGGDLLLCGSEGGGVGIGILSPSSIPTGYLLAVDGKGIFEELRVEMSGQWPDYVFEEEYDLRTISELSRFIEQHGHLPNIPSAAEIESKGILLGEMQNRMIEKIEELTLYIIELENRISHLEGAKIQR